MKKYSRIFGYLRKHNGKIALYFVCTILATLFGVISIGMLIPFFGLIFDTGQSSGGDMIKTNVLGSYITNTLIQIINEKGKIAGLTAICILIIIATILKNSFLYLSNRISVPLRSLIITQLRGELYDKILRLPIGYFTEKRKGDRLLILAMRKLIRNTVLLHASDSVGTSSRARLPSSESRERWGDRLS